MAFHTRETQIGQETESGEGSRGMHFHLHKKKSSGEEVVSGSNDYNRRQVCS